jgi:hypothetical protein
MKQDFVTFLSPGTLFAETTTKPIEDWNIFLAVEMSKSVAERYDAKPYAFFFTTREREDNDLDSKVTKTSHKYYLGGFVYSLEEFKKFNNPDDAILIRNLERSGYKSVIVNTNSWKATLPLNPEDVVLSI